MLRLQRRNAVSSTLQMEEGTCRKEVGCGWFGLWMRYIGEMWERTNVTADVNCGRD